MAMATTRLQEGTTDLPPEEPVRLVNDGEERLSTINCICFDVIMP